jgi:hypothetical protein
MQPLLLPAPLPDDGTADSHLLLHHLQHFIDTAPDITKAIFSHNRPIHDALRGTNRLLRTAVNSTVNTLRLVVSDDGPTKGTSALLLASELAVSFPNVVQLKLDLRTERSRPDAARSYLSHLCKVSPRLVSGLQDIDLMLHESAVQDSSVALLARLLSR